MGLLTDKIGLVFGVANRRSIAWAIAQAWHQEGARLAFTYQGERVREYVIEGFVDGAWKELCTGTAIGHKKIDRIESSTVSKVRLRTTKAAAVPKIRKLAVYKTEE